VQLTELGATRPKWTVRVCALKTIVLGSCSEMEMHGFRGEPPSRMPPPPQPPVAETRIEIVPVDDLLDPPRRYSRPDHIVVIIRGLPGAGKTYVSKLLKVISAVVFFTDLIK